MIDIMELDEQELQDLVLELIGIIDYDLQKDCQYEIEENGFDLTVDEVAAFLIARLGD